ncbi:ferredoxin-type protein NapF [Azonexus sp.]|uniref:ferredoxin-type protein NapF n=1 Tax=Azonexus sp. TaxID=1872668 RepID=UPI00359F607D
MTNVQLSRRAFFGAARPGQGEVVRPPWALPEREFQDACTRCNACVDICPTGLLVKGAGAYPEADFTPGRAPAGCTFCGDCLTACKDMALRQEPEQAPWALHAVFTADCLATQNVVCRTCGESCEVSAIRFPPMLGGVAKPLLDESACTGCGACLADCPTLAIRITPSTFPSFALRGAA